VQKFEKAVAADEYSFALSQISCRKKTVNISSWCTANKTCPESVNSDYAEMSTESDSGFEFGFLD